MEVGYFQRVQRVFSVCGFIRLPALLCLMMHPQMLMSDSLPEGHCDSHPARHRGTRTTRYISTCVSL